MYDIDPQVYPFVASDYDGRLCGFINAPVRDYSMREWIDSVTGDPGVIISFEAWDQSMREPAEMTDFRLPIKERKPKKSVMGKKGSVYGTGEFTQYKYKLKGRNRE
jgi:hypothetical protein